MLHWGSRPSMRASMHRGRRRGVSGIGFVPPPPHILGQDTTAAIKAEAEKQKQQLVARRRRATERASVHAAHGVLV